MIPRVKGTHDLLDMKFFNQLIALITKQLNRYHFAPVATPILEPLELFKRTLGMHTDVVTKEMFVIETAADEQDKICLRPEGTAPLMRAYLQDNVQEAPWKVFQCGPMFRHERPQKGRFRQFHQVTIEVMQAASLMHDVELITMLDRFFDDVLHLDTYVLLINFLGCAADRQAYEIVLKKFLAKLPAGALCANCQVRQEKNLLRIFDCKTPTCQQIYTKAPLVTDHLCAPCQIEWEQLQVALRLLSVTYQHDPRLVRGLDYYTKTVFEFASSNLGAQATFCAGGRYDGLAQQLGSPNPVPAVGAAVGIERVLLLMLEQPDKWAMPPEEPLAVILPLSQQQISLALILADTLRFAGIATEVLLETASIKSMMRTANKMAATWALLLGEEEQQTQTVTIKYMMNARQERVSQLDVVAHLKRN